MEEIIEITDSPDIVTNVRKRKRNENEGGTASPKHPLLESISHRFQQNAADRQYKMTELGNKREAEIAHSNYIKRNIADPRELRKANETVKYWVQRNGVKNTPILGTRSNQHPHPTTPSRLNNQSQQRSGIPKNSSKTTTNGKQTKQSQNSNDEVENTAHACNFPTDVSVDLTKTDYAGALRSSSDADIVNLLNDSSDCIDIANISNNSNSPEGTPTGRSKRKYVTRQTSRHVCAILNCEAVFSSEGALGQHKNLFQHSPCNPCLKALDCKLSADPLCFMCPECDNEFQTADACRKHMRSSSHLTFLPPLSITGYMCGHCLHVFESYVACWEHIEESKHKDIAYPFVDDQGPNADGGIGPVPLAEELLQDFIQKCAKVPFRVQCLECTMDMENPAVLRHHMMETNNLHIVSVLSDTNLVDVFASYLAGYSCDNCHRLFNGGLKELAKHQCAKRIIGTIVENNSRSFSEFIKRCALTVIKSEDDYQAAGSESRPGPSHVAVGTSPKRRNRKVSVTEICASPFTVGDDELDLTEGLSEDGAIFSKLLSKNKDPPKSPKTQKKTPVKAQSKPSSSPPEPEGATCIDLIESNSLDNIPSIAESKRKKTKLDQMGKYPPKENDRSTTTSDTAMLGLPIDTHPSQSSIQGVHTGLPRQTLLPSPPSLQPISRNYQQRPPLLPTPPINQKNFYCHPPPQNLCAQMEPLFTHPGSGNPRYPLRNQNRNDGSNSISKKSPGNLIRIGQKTAEPSTAHAPDHQVAGPSQKTDAAPETVAMDQSAVAPSLKRDRSRSPVIGTTSLVSIENLMTKENIIFLDLDNWPGFFSKLPRVLPKGTFVWGFFGGRNVWREPHKCFIFHQMKIHGQFYLNEQCGFTKDAADFCIVLSVGKMDALLPTNVAFTILSGDKGFCEVERQMKRSSRKAVVINPHNAEQFSTEMIYTMVTSVTDT